MPQSQCLRIPLNPEAADDFLAFMADLRGRTDELRAVLAEEGMLAEAVFVDRQDDEVAIILFTKAEDLAKANAAFQQSTHPIQERMRQLSATAFDLENARALEVGLDLTGPFSTD